MLLKALLWCALLVIVHSRCIHDEIMRLHPANVLVSPQNYSLPFPTKRSNVGTRKPIRILPVYMFPVNDSQRTCHFVAQRVPVGEPFDSLECGELVHDSCFHTCTKEDILSEEKIDAIEELVDSVVSSMGSWLRVNRVSGPLRLAHNECNIKSPLSFSKGFQAADSDMVLFVTGRPILEAKVLAYGGDCMVDGNRRPIAGAINIDPATFEIGDSVGSHQEKTVLHEILHAIGFSFRKISDFPFGVAKSLKVGVRDGVERTVLITPKVKEKVREHFGCSALEGAELENEGGGGTSLSHFEKRIFMDEVMTGVASAFPVLSTLTMAFLEDSGWYSVDYSYAEPLTWGRGLGCEFPRSRCSLWDEDYFCRQQNKKGCSVDLKSKSVCSLGSWTLPLPEKYQYFRSENLGGTVSLTDYCPIFNPFSNGKCTITTDQDTPLKSGERKCASCRCFHNTLHTANLESEQQSCYETHCTSSDNLFIVIDNIYYPCTQGKSIITLNYEGVIHCPDKIESICFGVEEETASVWSTATKVIPESASPGDQITIQGLKFSEGMLVQVGKERCSRTEFIDETTLLCTLSEEELEGKQVIIVVQEDERKVASAVYLNFGSGNDDCFLLWCSAGHPSNAQLPFLIFPAFLTIVQCFVKFF